MNRDQLVQQVLDHQFSETQYTDFARNVINEGLQYVVAQTDFPQLWEKLTTSVSAGTDSLTLPADFSRLYSLSVQPSTNEAPSAVRQIRSEDYDLLNRQAETGKPYFYDVNGLVLDLFPTTDASYNLQLNYYRKPSELTASTDEPEIPSQYHHLLVSYALVRCFERENDYDAATYHRQRFEQDVLKCRSEVQYSTADSSAPKTVGGSWTSNVTPTVWY